MNNNRVEKMNFTNPGPPPYRGWNYSGNFAASNCRTQGHMTTHLNFNPLPPPPLPAYKGKSGGTFLAAKPKPKSNWKLRKGEKRKESGAVPGTSQVRTYELPKIKVLQVKNRVKGRRFYPKKKKFNKFAPCAPRNTTSFLIRAKKAGGIASLVSPCPVTPAVLPTPVFSPAREGLVEMANEEWGVNGYGSMNGLIRLRSTGADAEHKDDESSSESDVEEHVEVERRLDHDLSRFEMICPSMSSSHVDGANVLETRVDDQDRHIAHLEEENLTLKQRLFLMEQHMHELRFRLRHLECGNGNYHQLTNQINVVINDNSVSGNDAPQVFSEKSVGDGDADASSASH
eukprot:Gb_06511 [translate_table: standard]